MFQLNNHTPFAAELHPSIDQHGRDFLVVIIKASFVISPLTSSVKLAEAQQTIQHADEFYGEPGESSIKKSSDLALEKPATDLIVIGQVHAPGGRRTHRCDASVTIGETTRRLAITGDRIWEKQRGLWAISAAQAFERMPLVYENAYGGIAPSKNMESETRASCLHNPCGKGFIEEKGEPVEGLALPNIEEPQSMITKPNDRPLPAGFGAIARDWQPRLGLAGTYDEDWQAARMPLLPLDFDPSFFNAAHPAMRFAPHLRGDEALQLTNLNESGAMNFRLPGERPSVEAKIRGEKKAYVTVLDTVLIQPDDHSLMLAWRAAIACAGKLLYVDTVDIRRGS